MLVLTAVHRNVYNVVSTCKRKQHVMVTMVDSKFVYSCDLNVVVPVVKTHVKISCSASMIDILARVEAAR